MTTEAIIAATAKLLERLGKLVKNKEVFDIVRDVQVRQRELETNTKQAEAQAEELQKEMTQLKKAHSQEIANLREAHAREIANLKKEISHDQSNAETKILLFLNEHDDITTEQVAVGVELSVSVTEFHLNEMAKTEVVVAAYNMCYPTRWFMGQNGRRRLFDSGLLK